MFSKQRFWKDERTFGNVCSKIVSIVCSPNEDIERPNKRFGPCFQSSFHILKSKVDANVRLETALNPSWWSIAHRNTDCASLVVP